MFYLLIKLLIALIISLSLVCLVLVIWAMIYVYNGGEINIKYDREEDPKDK